MSGELNYTVNDVQQVIGAVKEQYRHEGTEDFTDGYLLELERAPHSISVRQYVPLRRVAEFVRC